MHTTKSIDHEAWRKAYIRQLEFSAREFGGRSCGSVYFGGGTPSLMAPDIVASVIDCIATHWNVEPDAEVTCEVNPTSAEARKFEAFRSAGVNRLSIGVQSLDDASLKRLGRLHTAAQARSAFNAATRYFDNVSIDLIYGRQYQQLSNWQLELEEVVAWQPRHISVYHLTIEPGTPFGKRHEVGKLPGLPREQLAADMYSSANEIFEAAGYRHYEVSSFAKPGAEGRHNYLYWRGHDCLGIGPGAHGRITVGARRAATETIDAPGKWLAAVEERGTGEEFREWLDEETQAEEYIITSLRLDEGLDIRRYTSLKGSKLNEDQLRDLLDDNLVLVNDGRIRATARGRLFVDMIACQLSSETKFAFS